MAHVGEEFALGTVGFLRFFSGNNEFGDIDEVKDNAIIFFIAVYGLETKNGF